jgi:CheY-like chemotaxis protein
MAHCVLVVDDSLDGREMLSEYLAFRGFHVIEATDGASAIEVARRVRPAIVLMDLSMAGIDGWEATRVLKADPLTKHAVVIAVTAHAFLAEQQAARTAGCDAVIPKPYDLAFLANGLERVLSKGLAAFDAEGIAAKAAPGKPKPQPAAKPKAK